MKIQILHGKHFAWFSLVFVISFVFVIFFSSETRDRAAKQNCKGGRSIPVPADKNYMVNIRATTHHPPTIHHLFHFCETKVGWYKNNFFAKQLNEKDAGTLPKLICKWRGWMDHKLSRVAIRFPSGALYQSQKKGFHLLKKVKTKWGEILPHTSTLSPHRELNCCDRGQDQQPSEEEIAKKHLPAKAPGTLVCPAQFSLKKYGSLKQKATLTSSKLQGSV